MNLENYLSATLPTAVVAKIFEEQQENNNGNDKNDDDSDTDDLNTSTIAKRQKLEVSEHEAKTDSTSSVETPATVEDSDDECEIEFNETNLVNILMQSFNAGNPRELLTHMIPSYVQIPESLDNFDICRLIFQMVSSEDNVIKRTRLLNVTTIDHVVDLIQKCNNIVILTGAGCSVSCGIPDFRSRNGIYARLHKDFPDLPDPQSMFDIAYFQRNPHPFFKFAKEIYPGQFKPSLSHLFIKKIEENKKLLRNYTQNIDTIELTAGIKNIIQCHGSFATATCTNQDCKFKVNADDIREVIFNQEIPKCKKCNEVGILKPDIVFFGESLPESYHKAILDDKEKCDLLIVIGSSLKVKPVAHIPSMLKENVPQILINRESLNHMNFDVELLGDCDVIVRELLLRLNDNEWTNVDNEIDLKNTSQKLELIDDEKLVAELILEKHEIAQPDSKSEDDIVDIEQSFVSTVLKENSFIHLKPNIYVFKGSEMKLNAARKYLLGSQDEESDDESTNDGETCSSCSTSNSGSNRSDVEGDSNGTTSDNSDSSKVDEVDKNEIINDKHVE